RTGRHPLAAAGVGDRDPAGGHRQQCRSAAGLGGDPAAGIVGTGDTAANGAARLVPFAHPAGGRAYLGTGRPTDLRIVRARSRRARVGRMSAPAAWFVTGTDTEIGKTLVSAAMLHALSAAGVRAAGMKPVAAG